MVKPGSRRSRRAAPGTAGRAGNAVWVAIFAAALLLRVLYVWSIRDAYFFDHLQTEPLRYQEWATLIVDGHAPPPPFEQAPGYAYFVAAIFAVAGRSVAAVALTQALLDAVTCVLIALAARTWFGARVGRLAGVLAAAYGPLIYFSAEVLPASLLICTTMLAVLASRRAAPQSAGTAPDAPLRSPSAAARSWWIAGSLWGIASLVRSEIVLAWPFALVDAWKRGGRHGLVYTAVPIAGVLASLVAVNAAFSHRLAMFTTSGGVNLWLGNNPHADGVNPFLYGPLERTADTLRQRAAGPVEMDRLFTAQAVAFWREQPSAALRLLWRKLLWTWTGRELPNSSDIDWQTAQSWLFRIPIVPLRFGVVFPLALAGALLVGGAWADGALLAALPAVALGTSLLFFTNARFRLIMVPSVLILAALALEQTAQFVRERRAQRAALIRVAAGIAVGVVATRADFFGVWTYRIPQISVNTGVLERESGQLGPAVQHLREGLAGDPDDTIAWIHLALALEQQGEVRPALQAYLDALARAPTDGTLQQMAGRFVARHQLDMNLLQQYVTAPDEGGRAVPRRQLLDSVQPRVIGD